MADSTPCTNSIRGTNKEVEVKAGKPRIPVKVTLPDLNGPPLAGVVLAHGAGGDMDSGHLPYLAKALAAGGVPVVRFTCRTLHLPTRVAAFQAVLDQAAGGWAETADVRSWVCAGHSMGGRAACQVAFDAGGGGGARKARDGPPDSAVETAPAAAAAAAGRADAGSIAAPGKAAAAAAATTEGGRPDRKRRRREAAGPPAKTAATEAGDAAGPAAGPASGDTGSVAHAARRSPRACRRKADPPLAAAAAAAVAQPPADAQPAAAPASASGRRRVNARGAPEAAARADAMAAAAGGAVAAAGGAAGPSGGGGGGCGAARGRGRRPRGEAGATAAPAADTTQLGRSGAAPVRQEDPGRRTHVSGCVLLSYPLHPPDKPDQLRDEPLVRLRCPVLFVRGTRDTFSRADLFQRTLERMTSEHVEVHTVEGGDHGLVLPRRGKGAGAAAGAPTTEQRQPEREGTGKEPQEVVADVAAAVLAFVREVAGL